MKKLLVRFTDQEAAELAVIKIALGLNWHDYIMILTKLTAKQIKEFARK